jgi:hypothetical protein
VDDEIAGDILLLVVDGEETKVGWCRVRGISVCFKVPSLLSSFFVEEYDGI